MAVRVRRRAGGGGRSPRPPRIVDTLAAVAEFAGVTVPSVSAWFDRGAPVMQDGRYDLWDIARWHGENVGQGAGGGGQALPIPEGAEALVDDGGDGSRSGWELRRVRAGALSAELKLREARREVISMVEHNAVLMALTDSFVTELEQMPRKVAPLLMAARGYQEISQILEEHIRMMRIQLAAKHAPQPAAGERQVASEPDGAMR